MFYMCAFLTLLESTAVEADAMKFNFLFFNPVWGFLFLSVITGFYVVVSGYRSVVITVVLGIIFISTSGFWLAALTHKYKDFRRLLPVFENGINQGFLICIAKLVASLASFIIVFPMLKDVSDKKNIFKMALIGLAFTAQIQIFCMIGSITTFEPSLLNAYPFPKLTQTQRIHHFGVLEAGELFVMLQILGGWIVKYVTSFFVLDLIYQRLGKKKQTMDIITSIIVFAVGCAVAYNLFELFNFLEIYIWVILVNFFIVPVLVFTVFAIRAKSPQVSPAENNAPPDSCQVNAGAIPNP